MKNNTSKKVFTTRFLVSLCLLLALQVFTNIAKAATPPPSQGTGLNFDGTDDYISINSTLGNVGTGDFTIEMSVKTTQNYAYLISKRGYCGYDNFISLQIIGGAVHFEIDGGNSSNYTFIIGTTTVNDGNWHHLVVTRIAGNVKLYIDANLEGSTFSLSNISNNYTLTLGVGVCTGNVVPPYGGDMDDVRFWNRGTTQTELNSRNGCKNSSSTTGLIANYTFTQGLEGSDNTGIDTLIDSKSNNTGYLHNFTLDGNTSNWTNGEFKSNCGSCGGDTPTGVNTYNGNVTLNTQTQVNDFYSLVSGPNQYAKWTKINGSLTINGSNTSDPITNLCNLFELTEITGSLTITAFNQSSNPTSLDDLLLLTTIGCNLNINNCNFTSIELPNLLTVGCSFYIKDNLAKTIVFDRLTSVKGDQFQFKNNSKAELIRCSYVTSGFNFTGKGSSVDISNNGNNTTNPLIMDFKKITTVKGPLVFHNNDNTNTTNFDAIFSGLTSIATTWGNLVITNNNYLNKCCIAASATVAGSRTITGNTGNCANITAVQSDCGTLHKRSLTTQTTPTSTKWTIAPNPSNGNFILNLNNSIESKVSISICDMYGRVVYTQNNMLPVNAVLPINLDTLTSGQYLAKIAVDGLTTVKHIAIIR